MRVSLCQWFLTFTNTPNPYVVFQAFAEPHFPNITESKNFCDITRVLVMFQMTFVEPLNPRGSIEPKLRTTALCTELSQRVLSE